MYRHGPLALGLALYACTPNTDLVVAPPPAPKPRVQVVVPDPLDSGRLPDGVAPRGYRVRLDIDPRAKRFSGEVWIDLALDRSVTALVLHGSGQKIRQAEVRSGKERIALEPTFRRAAGAKTDAEELVLAASADISEGLATLHLAFDAPLDDRLRGLYHVRDGGRDYVFSQLEPSDARRMLPCFDDPVYKVPFDVELVVPKENLALSNTPVVKQRTTEDGKQVFTFAASKPMPTYLLAVAVGPFETREGPTEPVPIRVVTTPGQAALGATALATAADHLKILADYFGQPYPYPKLDLVAVPNFGPGAMENAGLVTFREELILLDPAKASAKSRRDMALVVAHELAHQWFGNLVTMKWWDDLWLNEGFATYLEATVVDSWRPDMRAGLENLAQTGWVMGQDALDSARRVRQPVSNTYQAEEAFDGITYVKGMAVIGMLAHWLGDGAFRAGVQSYLRDNAWKNATAADMFSALAAASKQDVAGVASTFLDQPGVPLVRATLACDGKAKPRVSLSQQRYRGRKVMVGAASDPLWRIPVCLLAGDDQGGTVRACEVLGERSAQVELPMSGCPAWLLPNADYRGYYRYAMGAAQIADLARASVKLDARAKVGLLSNAWALVQAGELEGSDWLDLLDGFKNERQREVVAEVVEGLKRTSDALVDAAAQKAFDQRVRALLLPLGKQLGWDRHAGESDDDRLLRKGVLSALAQLTDDKWVADQALARAHAYLGDPSAADGDTAVIALQVAARLADEKVTFDALVERLKRARHAGERVLLVQALASLRGEATLRRVLDLLLDGTIRSGDAVYLARTMIDLPDARPVLLGWLEQHFDELTKKLGAFGVSRWVGVIERICQAQAVEQAGDTFRPLVAKAGGSTRALDKALEKAGLCVDLRARQAGPVSKYLTSRGVARRP